MKVYYDAICPVCNKKRKITDEQWLMSFKIYCRHCRKYWDNPFAPKFKRGN